MEQHGKQDDDLFRANATNVAPGGDPVGGTPLSEQPAVGLFDVQPDQSLRTFDVLTVDPRGRLNQERILAHGVHTDAGALVVSVARAGAAWTTRIFAPGTWLRVEGDVPTRAELAEFSQTVDRFYREQGALKEQVQQAEQREAAARAHAANGTGRDGSRSTGGLLNHTH